MEFARSRFYIIAAAVGGVALLASACGGGDGKKVDPEDWVDDFCDRVIEFSDDSDEQFEAFFEIDPEDKSAKDDVVKVFEEQRDLVVEFEKDFDKLGTPDSDNGSKIIKAAKENFADRKELLDDLIKDLKKVDTGDDFEDDVLKILDDASENEPDGFRERLEDIDENDADDIIDLIEEDEDCVAAAFDE